MKEFTEIKKTLHMLRSHFIEIEMEISKSLKLVEDMEIRMLDLEDQEYCQKYGYEYNAEAFEEAAAGMNRLNFHLMDSPPRPKPSRCGNNLNGAAGFFQSIFYLN